jgi:hypothetical protein
VGGADQIFEGDVLFIEWSAPAANTKASDGVDGEIVLQTVRHTLQSTE